MNEFEQQLVTALGRREPSPDFTQRVLAAVERQNHPKREPKEPVLRHWTLIWRLLPATAALLIAMSGALYQHHERTVQGEAAKQQLLAAMKIAGEKLHSAQQHVADIGEIRINEGSY